ncbi:MFS transporter, partial [Salmonella enterica subsp. enterica serovar Enteritidis]|nr:MFS transporter [Salmonella enterica subsp. enterica serovar Enteritidis]
LSAGLSAIFIFFGSVGAGLVLSLILYSVSYFLIGRLNSTQAPEANHEASSSLSIQTSNFFEGIKIIRSNTLIAVIVPIALVTNFCFWTVWLLMPKLSIDIFSEFKYMYNA